MLTGARGIMDAGMCCGMGMVNIVCPDVYPGAYPDAYLESYCYANRRGGRDIQLGSSTDGN